MKQNNKEFYKKILERFKKNNPSPQTELRYKNPFQLLVAVVLSAQCTDVRVNQITKELFKYFPDAPSMAKASEEEIFNIIKSCSYPNNKSRYLKKIAEIIHNHYNDNIPNNRNELMKLPGVGRKSANVVLSILYKEPVIAVDTHVFRVAKRIGLVKNAKTPLDVELQLTKNIPKELLYNAHHWFIIHGRYTCKAHKPRCNNCIIIDLCLYHNKHIHSYTKS